MNPTLGMVVAMASEARLLLGRGAWRRVKGRWIRSVRLADGTRLIAARAGLGAQPAYEAAAWLISQGASALMGMGLAGGLAPGLKAGQLVVATHVLPAVAGEWRPDAAGAAHARAVFASEGGCAVFGPIVTASEGVLTVAGKASLFRETRALAVDMESAGIARAAGETQLPFFVMRAICDPADAAVPPALSDCLGQSGRLRPGALALKLAIRPSLALDMVHMGKCFAAAGQALKGGWRHLVENRLPLILALARAASARS